MPRSLFLVAGSVGLAFANVTVAIPLLVVAAGWSASVAGDLLATATAATAVGALLSAPLRRRLAGPSNAMVVALVLVGTGDLVLMSGISAPGLTDGAALVGSGNGVFWVSSQVILGAHSGAAGSERGFLLHYALFTAGTVVGSALTGVGAATLGGLGASRTAAIQATLGIGLASVVVGMLVWRPCASRRNAQPGRAPRLGRSVALDGLRVQLPDLLLVAGLAMLVPLTPIVLVDTFDTSTLAAGLVMAGIAVAKIGGTLVARRLVSAHGTTSTILAMIAVGAALSLLLTAAFDVWVFVPTVLAAVLTVTGAWPLVVDAGQARTAAHRRGALTIAWNVREYGIIAGMTVGAGWLYGAVGAATPLFAVGALLLALAAATAAVVLRMPVVTPTGIAIAPAPTQTVLPREGSV